MVGGPKDGKWEFKRCPFGLTQAPAYFQMLVNKVLEGLEFAFGYLDDILIYSKSMDEHLQHVQILFEQMRQADLKLTKRKWSQVCQVAFEMLKEYLLKEPILKYPKTDQPYILYTDASKYAWAGVLTQAYTYNEEGREFSIHHPITYVSGLFKGP